MKLLLSFALAIALSQVVPAVAIADSATHTFLLEMESPNIAQAPSGERVAILGEGEFSVHPKSVDAAGTFTHFNADGSVFASGTWTATELLEYQSYGCGVFFGEPISPDLCGGALKMRITATPTGTNLQIDAILTVFCVIGDHVPVSADEGVTLVVPGLTNFNKVVTGENAYVQLN
ncbi:MAG TPA: hypothetical protein VF998_08085 [Candidatus Limnocylindria bacterium]